MAFISDFTLMHMVITWEPDSSLVYCINHLEPNFCIILLKHRLHLRLFTESQIFIKDDKERNVIPY